MAEFDSGGLSAVSAFFGVDKKDTEPKAPQQTSSLHGAHRGRHGVGSSTTKHVKSTSADDTIGRVLKVGKRRLPEEADEQLEEGAVSHDSDEEQEEEGRTAIAEKSIKVPVAAVAPVDTKQSKKKKKKGKKERQAEQQASQPNGEGTAAPVAEGKVEADNTQEPIEEDSQKAKRKRHKVRSRQKNIYKDKRLTQHKPGHLIPGRAEFQGRPLTAETRAKLNLAPSRSSRQHHDSEEGHNVETKEHSSSGGGGVNLAIDDLLDEGEPQNKAHEVETEHNKTKKKKRKKSKYKNLR